MKEEEILPVFIWWFISGRACNMEEIKYKRKYHVKMKICCIISLTCCCFYLLHDIALKCFFLYYFVWSFLLFFVHFLLYLNGKRMAGLRWVKRKKDWARNSYFHILFWELNQLYFSYFLIEIFCFFIFKKRFLHECA